MKHLFLHIHTIFLITSFVISGFTQDASIESSLKLQTEAKQKKTFNFSTEAGPEEYFGYTLYQIGGIAEEPDGTRYKYSFPISEIKLPIDIFMFSCDVKGELFERFILHTNIKKNITNDAGKMEDSDWLGSSDHPHELIIYSESDAKLEAFIINTDFQVKTFSNSLFTLFTGAGFLYQNFKYDMNNLKTTIFNPAYVIEASGKIITYEIDYYIPYIEVTPCFDIKNKLKIMHRFAVSPDITAKDVDDHLLRYKESKSDVHGFAFITSLKTEYYLNSLVYFNLTLNYNYMYADGWCKQYQYKEYFDGTNTIPVGPIGKIENKIESSQFSVVINAGIRY